MYNRVCVFASTKYHMCVRHTAKPHGTQALTYKTKTNWLYTMKYRYAVQHEICTVEFYFLKVNGNVITTSIFIRTQTMKNMYAVICSTFRCLRYANIKYKNILEITV